MERPDLDKKNALNELAGQSWNLEMLISGIAIFSTSLLPEAIESALDVYLDNYLASDDLADILFPMLAYGFAKTTAYILIASFFAHFVLRAFWVGLVGLRAVFPDGIRYEKLPKLNDQLRERYRQRLGDSDDYIVKLDKWGNQLFSIAFVFVLFSIGMTLFYMVIFGVIALMRSLDPTLYQQWRLRLYYGFMAVAVLYLIAFILLSRQSVRENPRWAKWYVKLVSITELMYLGLYKPLSHILLVFTSYIPYQRYLTVTAFTTLIFMMSTLFMFTQKLAAFRGLPLMESRGYFSQGSESYQLIDAHYDNLRPEGRASNSVSIQSDVIKEPYLRLFVAYPKSFDADLHRVCPEVTLPESLSRSARRAAQDSLNLVCWQQYLQVSLNDSTLRQVEYLFWDQPASGAKGLMSYLPTTACKIGKNTLVVKTINPDSLPKIRYKTYATVPFWYAPEK